MFPESARDEFVTFIVGTLDKHRKPDTETVPRLDTNSL